MAEISAIMLAAGQAKRFGSNKLLHPMQLNGKNHCLLSHSLAPWLEIFSHVTVIIRPGSEILKRLVAAELKCDAETIAWVENPYPQMADSLARGIAYTRSSAGWVLGLADMPCLQPATIASVKNALIARYPLAAGFYKEQRGHPVGFSNGYLTELLSLQGDSGAKAILARDNAQLFRCHTQDSGVLIDIDELQDAASMTASSQA